MLAAIFDMDGLMYATEQLNMTVWIQVGKQHGWPITEEMCHEHIGMSLAHTREQMSSQLGPDFDFDAMRQARIDLVFKWIKENGMPVKSGLFELLTWLDEHKIKRAMATSTERRLVNFYNANVRDPELVERIKDFHAIITGEQVKHGKPAPDIFLEAARQLNVAPCDCVVFEDSYNGIKASHAANMIPVMVPDLLPPTPEILPLIHAKVDTLSDAIPVLEELLKSHKPHRGE